MSRNYSCQAPVLDNQKKTNRSVRPNQKDNVKENKGNAKITNKTPRKKNMAAETHLKQETTNQMKTSP